MPPTSPILERLRDMSRRLAAAAPVAPLRSALARPAVGGVEEIAAFGANPGRLKMRLHLPPRGARAGAPLLVLLHGCGQDPDSFAAASGFTALADRLGGALLLPTQLAENNQGRCFNWFQADDTRRDHGEAASIAQMARAATERTRADAGRVFVAGLSAGGAMAAACLAAYPDVFAGGAVVAGLPVGCARDVSSALTAMSTGGPSLSPEAWAALARASGPAGYGGPWPRVSIWQGSRDQTVRPLNADHLVAQWTMLQGVSEMPARQDVPAGGTSRRSWAAGGRMLVESWTIDGMKHGFPIAAASSAEPFVLPAGIDGASEIARFWGVLG